LPLLQCFLKGNLTYFVLNFLFSLSRHRTFILVDQSKTYKRECNAIGALKSYKCFYVLYLK